MTHRNYMSTTTPYNKKQKYIPEFTFKKFYLVKTILTTKLIKKKSCLLSVFVIIEVSKTGIGITLMLYARSDIRTEIK